MVRVYRVFGREGSSVFLVGEVCLGYSRARYRRPDPGFDPSHPRFSIGIVWIGGMVESTTPSTYWWSLQGLGSHLVLSIVINSFSSHSSALQDELSISAVQASTILHIRILVNRLDYQTIMVRHSHGLAQNLLS